MPFQMLKKHAILIALCLAITLLVVATIRYPGGSYFDKNAPGFHWEDNFFSDLFDETAVNGLSNRGRWWAVAGMIFYSFGLALFFVEFSKRIQHRSAANVIKYFGMAGMVCTGLIATPYHDVMVTMASTLFLLCMFYITVFVFMSKLSGFKVLCAVYLLTFYGLLYVYGSGNFWEYLPTGQKMLFAMTNILILGLHYFTGADDFRKKATKQQ
jgi:hypothetical protein